MKYTLNGFSQEVALSFKKTIENNGKEKTIKIDCTDLTILRWFVDFYPNMRKMTVDGKEYAWLTHKKLIDDLPILDISKRSCVDRMQKLVEFEILEYTFVKDGGTFSLYRFGKNYEKLIASSRSEGMQSNAYGEQSNAENGTFEGVPRVGSNAHPVSGQTGNKDTSFKDSSFKDTSIKDSKRKKFIPPTLDDVIEYANSRKSSVDPKKFFDYYDAGEWKDAKGNPVKNWKQKLITWENNNNGNTGSKAYGKNGVAISENKKDDFEGIF